MTRSERNAKNEKRVYGRVMISLTLTVLFMGAIFLFSSQISEQSNSLSVKMTELIVRVLKQTGLTEKAAFSGITWEIANHIVRKGAHFLNYLVLGFLLINVFRISKVKKWKSVLWSIGLCAAFAVTDEVHQLFVPGRGPRLADVFIDTAGSAVGVRLYILFTWNSFIESLFKTKGAREPQHQHEEVLPEGD